jgi:hypothetical protein
MCESQEVRQLTKAGCKKVFCEVATGAKTDRAHLRWLLDAGAEDRGPPATCGARDAYDLARSLGVGKSTISRDTA